MLQRAARTETPRGTSRRLIAKPSGLLCTAIARDERASASLSANDTPTPTPSVNECTVITPTINGPRARRLREHAEP